MDEETPRSRMRAADTDRERVAEQLRSAHGEGRLDLTEYDQRIQQAWAARTYGELDALTDDLPQPRPPAAALEAHSEVHRSDRQHWHWRSGRTRVSSWASATLICLTIWALVCLSTMDWTYPWWIWVTGPWGAVLLADWITERARGSRAQR